MTCSSSNKLDRAACDGLTVLILLNVSRRGVGIMVDDVSDVHTLTPAQLCPTPALGTSIQSDLLLVIGSVDDRMPSPIDIEERQPGAGFGRVDRPLVPPVSLRHPKAFT